MILDDLRYETSEVSEISEVCLEKNRSALPAVYKINKLKTNINSYQQICDLNQRYVDSNKVKINYKIGEILFTHNFNGYSEFLA